MDSTRQSLTAEHLLAMGSDARFELVKGELRPMSPAGSRHGRIITRIAYPLTNFVNQHKLGEVFGSNTGFILSRNPDTVRAPYIAFVPAERMSAVGDTDAFCPGAPDLAVEVMSPGDRISEVMEKISEYHASGCRAVWIVNSSKRTVTVYCPDLDPIVYTDGATIDGGQVVPGFSLDVKDIFPQ